MAGFVKLDVGILNSTLWTERDWRDVFLTALLMAMPFELQETAPQLEVDSLEPTGWSVPPGWYGFVPAAGVGILRRAMIEDNVRGIEALRMLGSPEPSSRSQDFEGRRLVRIDGGYLVLNFIKYRDRDYTAPERMKRWRERQAKKNAVTRNNSDVTRIVTQTDTQTADLSERVSESSPSDTGAAEARNGAAPEDTLRVAELRETLLDLGVFRLSPKKLDGILPRLMECGWTPASIREASAAVGGKDAKQRAARLASLLSDEERFDAFNNDLCRRQNEERNKR